MRSLADCVVDWDESETLIRKTWRKLRTAGQSDHGRRQRNEIFVYYSDDHFEMGGVGLEEFGSREKAAEFIGARMKTHPNAKFENYTIIDGEKLTPKAVEVITKIAFE